MLEYCWTLCSFQFSFLGKIGFGGNIYWQSRHTKQLFWKCFTFAIYGIHKEENKTNIALPGAEFKILPKYCTIQGWLYYDKEIYPERRESQKSRCSDVWKRTFAALSLNCSWKSAAATACRQIAAFCSNLNGARDQLQRHQRSSSSRIGKAEPTLTLVVD